MSAVIEIKASEQLPFMPVGTVINHEALGRCSVQVDAHHDCLACVAHDPLLDDDIDCGGCRFLDANLKPMCGRTEREDDTPIYYRKEA